MDQDAFRSLLNAPREGAAGGPSSARGRRGGVLGGTAPKRGWGLKPRKDKEPEKTDEAPKESRPAFVPRTHQKKAQQSGYKDRAAMRRQGDVGEYEGVTALYEEFERRKAEAGADAQLVEAQRAHLGGDEEHSVLVKGLDFALLAKRKAELEREKADKMDDELDSFGRDIGSHKGKGKGNANAPPVQDLHALSSRFKSIAQKNAEAEAAAADKRRKKKKQKERGETAEASAARSAEARPEAANVPRSKPSVPKVASPPPNPEDEDDIFGDAGTYDLTAGRGDDDDDDDDDDEDDGAISEDEPEPPRGRSRSRSRADDRSSSRSRGRSSSRDRSYSRDKSYSRDRSYSRERYRHRSYSRERSYTPDRRRSYSRSRSRSRDRYSNYDRDDRRADYDRGYGRRRNQAGYREQAWDDSDRGYARRHRSGSRSQSPRRRDDRDSRHGTADRHDRHGYGRRRSRSRSPAGKARRRSPSPSRSPPRAVRARTRSPTPLLQQTLPFISRSPTPESDEDTGPVTRLQPLASTAMADVRGFLDADSAGAKDDARRASKARWRAAQGMATQEGTDPELLKKTMSDKTKANRDYQLVMNRVNKEKKG